MPPKRKAAPAITVDSFEKPATALKALADPVRLFLLSRLSREPQLAGVSVTELTAACSGRVSQPTVSHHLRILYQAGYVSSHRAQDRFTYYSLEPHSLGEVRAVLSSFVPADVAV